MGLAAAICRQLTADRRTDGELLAAFFDGPSEEAFVELVRRHGPLVWGTCRRLLPDPADAEDAFQAAFLVLVRRARGLTRVAALGPWLHRVAVWTARNVRRKNARRFVRQNPLPEDVTDPAAPPDPHLKFDLDAALLALPARYRDPIILCHLLGFTRREAAEQLGCPEGTLSAWLTRGLAKLRHRLRGLDPAKALAGAAVAAPATLSAATAKAAVASAAAASVPPTVSVLVEGVIRMFWVKKATAATFALVATFALGVGVGLGTRTESSGADAQDKTPGSKPKTEPAPAERDPQLAELEAELAATEAARRAAAEGVKVATARLERSRAKKADPKEIQDDEVTLYRFLVSLETATAQGKLLKDKLDKLKTAKQKPADPFAKPPAAAEIDRKLAELKKELEALDADRGKLEDLKKLTDAKTAALERQIRQLMEDAKALEAKRAELQPGGAKPGGAYLEVSVMGKDAMWPCRVKEFGSDGKPVGSVIAEDLAVLPTLFSRAMKDPGGPREVRILTAKDTPAARLHAVLDACKQAGFQKVSQSTKAADIDPRLDKVERLAPDIDRLLKEKAELESHLKRGPADIDRLLKEKAELEDYIKRLEKTRPVKP